MKNKLAKFGIVALVFISSFLMAFPALAMTITGQNFNCANNGNGHYVIFIFSGTTNGYAGLVFCDSMPLTSYQILGPGGSGLPSGHYYATEWNQNAQDGTALNLTQQVANSNLVNAMQFDFDGSGTVSNVGVYPTPPPSVSQSIGATGAGYIGNIGTIIQNGIVSVLAILAGMIGLGILIGYVYRWLCSGDGPVYLSVDNHLMRKGGKRIF